MGYAVYVMPEVRKAVSQSNIYNLDDLVNRLSQREADLAEIACEPYTCEFAETTP